MTTQAYQLVMRQGPNPGKVFELSGPEAVIGRDISNQVTVNDAEVSRRHTRLEFQGGGYIVEDLGSTNGTFVNGRRLTGPHSLRPGETIRMGETVSFTYELLGGGGDATVAAARQQAAPAPRQAAPPPPPQRPAPSGYAGQVPAGPPAAGRRGRGDEQANNRDWLWHCRCFGCLYCSCCTYGTLMPISCGVMSLVVWFPAAKEFFKKRKTSIRRSFLFVIMVFILVKVPVFPIQR